MVPFCLLLICSEFGYLDGVRQGRGLDGYGCMKFRMAVTFLVLVSLVAGSAWAAPSKAVKITHLFSSTDQTLAVSTGTQKIFSAAEVVKLFGAGVASSLAAYNKKGIGFLALTVASPSAGSDFVFKRAALSGNKKMLHVWVNRQEPGPSCLTATVVSNSSAVAAMRGLVLKLAKRIRVHYSVTKIACS